MSENAGSYSCGFETAGRLTPAAAAVDKLAGCVASGEAGKDDAGGCPLRVSLHVSPMASTSSRSSSTSASCGQERTGYRK